MSETSAHRILVFGLHDAVSKQETGPEAPHTHVNIIASLGGAMKASRAVEGHQDGAVAFLTLLLTAAAAPWSTLSLDWDLTHIPSSQRWMHPGAKDERGGAGGRL